MSSRIEKMLAKTQGIRAAKDIPADEVVKHATPKTTPGTLAAWQTAQARIEELEAAAAAAGGSSEIEVDLVAPNPWQPRRVFNEDDIQKLAASIAEVGLIQPVIVRCVSITDTPRRYQLVAGERRLRAHKLLAMRTIRAIVIEPSDEEMAALALAENIDREDLTAYEIALAIRNAEASFPNRKSLAACLGINRTELYQYLAFFKLPDFVINDLDVTPGLLGRNAAEEIAATIKDHGEKAIEALRSIWPRIKIGVLDQGKIAATIEASILRGHHAPTDRDIKKLFVGKEQAGSITKDAKGLSIKIKAAALDPHKEQSLRDFVEKLFRH